MNYATPADLVRSGSLLLREFRSFWSIHPFAQDVFLWEEEYPLISDFLRSWTEDEVEQYEQVPHLHPRSPSFLIDLGKRCQDYIELPELYDSSFLLPKKQSKFIKEKKWKQLVPFLSTIPFNKEGYIDWCCGKGHLGRLLYDLHQCPVLGIEKENALVQWGLSHSNHDLYCCDVLTDPLPDRKGTMVALHSCGELLTSSIQEIFRLGLTQCVLVPCCYHKIRSQTHKPISRLGLLENLQLSKNELRIPSTFEHHPSQKAKERRRRDMLFRVVIDLILRDLEQQESYSSFPPVPDGWKDLSLSEYVEHVFVREGFSLPRGVDLSAYEQRGKNKLRMIRGLSSLRSMFIRPLEVWINADRALCLQEHGYDVELGLCMPFVVSPRNICIRASKPC